jgi:exodeoxyribonuclease VII large subunit
MDATQQRMTVTQATALVRECIEQGLGPLWVEGEISNFIAHRSGHFYFTLKDSEAQLRCVMFRGSNWRVRTVLRDGMQCAVFGRIGVYERSGQYQLIAERLVPVGEGELQLAYAALKARLADEGLFAPERKRPLPAYPGTIGVVSSPTGAAIRDIERVLRRRWPPIRIVLRPTLVQGAQAAPDIVSAIEAFNARDDIDLLIVGRGGGSLEDLWAFNEEAVARAIAAARVPVIAAVGHATDETIADFVADLRAPTPSAAAELAVPDYRETLAEARTHLRRGARALAHRLEALTLRLKVIERSHALKSPLEHLRQMAQRADEIMTRMHLALRQNVRATHQRVERLAGTLEALRPTAVLGRGYALAFDRHGGLVTSVEGVGVGDALRVLLGDGELHCRVEGRAPAPGEPGGRDPD